MANRVLQAGEGSAQERAARAHLCALVVMAKAPRPGMVKTRLSPPLTKEQAAELNVCFLRDTTENIAGVAGAQGLISYTPIGDEGLFEGLLPEGFCLVSQRTGDFGARLLGAAEDILVCGFGAVCLIDSDSPTVPAEAFAQAVNALAAPGEQVVLGPTADGGYYLIGLKRAEARLFERIDWSTEAVYSQTCERVREAGMDLVELPLWYDVDDRATLQILRAELLAGMAPGFAVTAGYEARWTREKLMQMDAAVGAATGAGGAGDVAGDTSQRPLPEAMGGGLQK